MDVRAAADKAVMVAVHRRLSTQSSVSDDLDLISSEGQQVQEQLLRILSLCVAVLKLFSPALPSILLDQVSL